MILTREITPATIRFGTWAASLQDAVDAEADPHLVLAGLEVDVGGALGHGLAEDAVDELDHRRVLGRLARSSVTSAELLLGLLLVLGDRLGDGALQRVELLISASMSSVGGDRDPAVEPGRHLDVVDRQHVGRVGHRDQQGLSSTKPTGSAW